MRYTATIKAVARDLFIKGFSYKEIASALDCTRQTVATWANNDWKQGKKKYHTDYLNTICPFAIIDAREPLNGVEVQNEKN